MTERSHLSIGEVLNLLQDEFPDITISKIRFLESQGLLDPERTPSGYRKFYEADIERLRWILRQQKENFLPLKVIKERLASGEWEHDEPPPAEPEQPVRAEQAEQPDRSEPAAGLSALKGGTSPRPPVAVGELDAPIAPADQARGRRRAGRGRSAASSGRPRTNVLDAGETTVSLSLEELSSATGLTSRQLGDLERFGLLASQSLGSTTFYGEDALVVARLAAAFLDRGVEPRHLRMYKVAAEREAGLFEQLVMPLLKQRAGGRQKAIEALGELAELGDQLRDAMLRLALRDYLGHH